MHTGHLEAASSPFVEASLEEEAGVIVGTGAWRRGSAASGEIRHGIGCDIGVGFGSSVGSSAVWRYMQALSAHVGSGAPWITTNSSDGVLHILAGVASGHLHGHVVSHKEGGQERNHRHCGSWRNYARIKSPAIRRSIRESEPIKDSSSGFRSSGSSLSIVFPVGSICPSTWSGFPPPPVAPVHEGEFLELLLLFLYDYHLYYIATHVKRRGSNNWTFNKGKWKRTSAMHTGHLEAASSPFVEASLEEEAGVIVGTGAWRRGSAASGEIRHGIGCDIGVGFGSSVGSSAVWRYMQALSAHVGSGAPWITTNSSDGVLHILAGVASGHLHGHVVSHKEGGQERNHRHCGSWRNYARIKSPAIRRSIRESEPIKDSSSGFRSSGSSLSIVFPVGSICPSTWSGFPPPPVAPVHEGEFLELLLLFLYDYHLYYIATHVKRRGSNNWTFNKGKWKRTSAMHTGHLEAASSPFVEASLEEEAGVIVGTGAWRRGSAASGEIRHGIGCDIGVGVGGSVVWKYMQALSAHVGSGAPWITTNSSDGVLHILAGVASGHLHYHVVSHKGGGQERNHRHCGSWRNYARIKSPAIRRSIRESEPIKDSSSGFRSSGSSLSIVFPVGSICPSTWSGFPPPPVSPVHEGEFLELLLLFLYDYHLYYIATHVKRRGSNNWTFNKGKWKRTSAMHTGHLEAASSPFVEASLEEEAGVIVGTGAWRRGSAASGEIRHGIGCDIGVGVGGSVVWKYMQALSAHVGSGAPWITTNSSDGVLHILAGVASGQLHYHVVSHKGGGQERNHRHCGVRSAMAGQQRSALH
ncbi:uncharacterized protein Dana_GF28074 [Drosophila ananassae]|uniref:Uncharacterized protein n=1 Tax=Drosophila ananassae TaxID=7217 RepID=A0A0P8XLQ0_DROAN|nr:uncharacterized protein Dana_GF28074 [Drosophila ananassae]